MDVHIPLKWRLRQYYLDKHNPPEVFPVFLKPEWGQNSNGVARVDSQADFLAFDSTANKIPYIVQYAAPGLQEYEIFYIRDANNQQELIELTITQSINRSDERYPINSVNNFDVAYHTITQNFTKTELVKIKTHLQNLPSFRIARIGIRADSKANLVSGIFHIVEVNLFAPFPINLLDKNISKQAKHRFIKDNMRHLVNVSDTTPKKHFNRFVFFKKIIKHYQSKTT